MTMSSPNLAPFAGQKYLNLESFKRDGTPVQTPVWFAEEQGILYIYTLANAGKVKRIAQFLAVCRRSKRVAMSTRRPRRDARLCRRWALRWREGKSASRPVLTRYKVL